MSLSRSPIFGKPADIGNQFTLKLQPTNCLSVFDHFVGFALKRFNSGEPPAYLLL